MFGYWAMGVLRRHAVSSGVDSVEIDLLNVLVQPPNELFIPYIGEWSQKFIECASRQTIPRQWIESAAVKLYFGKQAIEAEELIRTYSDQQNKRTLIGTAATCLVEVFHDLGGVSRFSRQVFCWPHDPTKEHQSTRAGRA